MPAALPLRIAGVGRYLPARIVRSAELEARCGLPGGWIERRTGVHERRWVNDETQSAMGAAAAREAVSDAGMHLDDIDLVINASGTAEQAIPDGGPLIQQALGLGDSGVPCWSLHATCVSFLIALETSAGLLLTERYRRILIVSADIASVGLNFEEPQSATLMGDAAAAVVVTRPGPEQASCIQAVRVKTYGAGAALATIRGGGCRRHPNDSDTTPEDNLFHMDGPAIYKLVQRHLRPFLERLRPGLSHGLGSIRRVIPHQPSGHALKSLRRLGWPQDKVVRTLDHLGNCVSASLPVTLYEAVKEGSARRGDELLLLGTGAGITIGGMIVTF